MIIFVQNNFNLERSEQELVRREKLKQLRGLGIDPYPAAAFSTDANSESIVVDFTEGKQVTIAGRLMSRRIQGKAVFPSLKIQKGGYRFTLTEIFFVQKTTKACTMMCTKSSWISEILLG